MPNLRHVGHRIVAGFLHVTHRNALAFVDLHCAVVSVVVLVEEVAVFAVSLLLLLLLLLLLVVVVVVVLV